MKIVQEFRQFIQRGNVIDLAVGVIMGTAFGKIVNSLVADVLMPPIGYVIGGAKFTDLKLTFPKVEFKNGFVNETLQPATLNYGQFLQTMLDFLIISICVFLMVKGINALQRRLDSTPPPVPAQTPSEKLLTEIRDLLKQQNAGQSDMPPGAQPQSVP